MNEIMPFVYLFCIFGSMIGSAMVGLYCDVYRGIKDPTFYWFLGVVAMGIPAFIFWAKWVIASRFVLIE